MWIDQTYRIVFFGHRDFSDCQMIEKRLYPLLAELIQTKPFVEIYLGRNGAFDLYTATIVKRVQKAIGNDNSDLICVLPYSQKDMEYYLGYYDHVIIPEHIEKVHPKGAITKRNRWMVEQADLLICYVEREEGGAYAALKYAEKLGKPIINLAKKDDYES